MNLYLDIETLPTDRADVREYIAAGVSPPGNISKAETIAKWNEESRPAAVEEAVAKTGLDGSFGRVCVIGWAYNQGDVRTAMNADNEGALLNYFAEELNDSIPQNEQFSTRTTRRRWSARCSAASRGRCTRRPGRLPVHACALTTEDDKPWSPLTDDGDALRLATALHMSVKQDDPNAAMAGWSNLQRTPITSNLMGAWYWKEWLRDHANDRTSATRRAIVRAAAEIGEKMG